MAQYKTGTATVVNNSVTVTGIGTAFVANVAVGNTFKVTGENAIYQIASVLDDTHLTLSPAYAGSTQSSVAYQITRDFTPNLGLSEISSGDVDWAYNLTQGVIRKFDTIAGPAIADLTGALAEASEYADAAALDAAAAAASEAAVLGMADGFITTSTTSWTPAIESKAFTVDADKLFTTGVWVSIVSNANIDNYGFGQVVSYSGTTLTVSVQVINGVTALTDWNISLSGIRGIDGVAGTDGIGYLWEGTWSEATTYDVNDAVVYDGSTYVCILESLAMLPTNVTYWTPMFVGLTDAQRVIASQAASDTVAGYVTTEAQSFAGPKTFEDVLTVQGTVATDGPTLGSELLTGGTWASTGWTGDNTSGWRNIPGNADILSHSSATEIAHYYVLTAIKTGLSQTNFTISAGGVALGTVGAATTGTVKFGFRAVSTAGISVTVTAGTWVSYISFSLKEIASSSDSLITLCNSSGTVVSEERYGASNLYKGVSSGEQTSGGTSNTGVGHGSLQHNITGNANCAFGVNTLINLTGGSSNFAGGSGSGAQVVDGDYNTFAGYNSGNTIKNRNGHTLIGYYAGGTLNPVSDTGDYNTFIGYRSGFHASQLTTADNSIAIGANSYTTANNQAVFGASTITETILRGIVRVPGFVPTIRTVTDANTTMVYTDHTIEMSTGALGRTVDLSAAVVGQVIIIKKIDSGAGAVTFVSTTSCTIDGSTTRSLVSQYESLTLVCKTAGESAVFDIAETTCAASATVNGLVTTGTQNLTGVKSFDSNTLINTITDDTINPLQVNGTAIATCFMSWGTYIAQPGRGLVAGMDIYGGNRGRFFAYDYDTSSWGNLIFGNSLMTLEADSGNLITTGLLINTPSTKAVTSSTSAIPVTNSNCEISTTGAAVASLADGTTVGTEIALYVKAVSNAGDSLVITPITLLGGTTITFAASPLGKGCILRWTSVGWIVVGTNGGVVA